MRVEPVACLTDNYAYLVFDERPVAQGGGVLLVDASEPAPVLAAIERTKLPLLAILSTHHHGDHVGGNEDVVARHPKAQVLGHRSDQGRIPAMNRAVDDGERFEIGALKITAHHVPGHTLGAVTYVISDGADVPWAFTGDTLFLAGCGRLFEGTAAQMHRSLNEILGALDPATKIGCGHEYTASNLRFARHVEPDNVDVAARVREVEGLRAAGRPTVPGTIGAELRTNPFMRVNAPAVRAHVGLAATDDPIEVLSRLRKEKDGFKG